MLSKSEFLDLVREETRVLEHLHARLPEGSEGFRLGEGMRSTEELLRYLAICGEVPVRALLADDWSQVREWASATAEMPSADFPQRMREQVATIERALEPVSDEELQQREVTLPWGQRKRLGAALVTTCLRFLSAYRYQLFCHAKAAGATELGTADAWLGGAPR